MPLVFFRFPQSRACGEAKNMPGTLSALQLRISSYFNPTQTQLGSGLENSILVHGFFELECLKPSWSSGCIIQN